LRVDDGVPLAVKGIADDSEGLELGVGDDDTCRIRLAVLDGGDAQSFCGGRLRDQFKNGFQRGEWFGTPIDGHEGKEAVFDLAPRGTVAGGYWATVIVSCSSVASGCLAFFHSALRTPRLSPPSAVISSS